MLCRKVPHIGAHNLLWQRLGVQAATLCDLVLAAIRGNVFASAKLCAMHTRVAHGARVQLLILCAAFSGMKIWALRLNLARPLAFISTHQA